MARIRSIKPEFFTSITNADLSVPARLHFIGLWTHVDDYGRGEDEPRLLKAALWALDDSMTATKVEALQAELEAAGKIQRYEVAGRRYFVVLGWGHQKIDRKTDSKLPEPPERGLVEDAASAQRDDSEGSSPDLDRIYGSDQDRISGSAAQAPSVRDVVEGSFAQFWDCYPASRRVDKKKCLAVFKTHRGNLGAIVDGALRWSDHWKRTRTEDQFIPHSTTWLNQQRWETLPPAPAGPKLSPSNQALVNVLSNRTNVAPLSDLRALAIDVNEAS